MKSVRINRWLRRCALLACGGTLAAAAVWLGCAPPLKEATRYPAGVILRDRTGQVLRVGLGPGDVDCRPSYRASFDDWIVRAAIAAEDKRFLSHGGVDGQALARALRQNLTMRRRISGASTITMQTVRLIRPHPRTLPWKAVESVQAARLERAWTKAEIMSQYLNRAPFGSNLVGIEAASRGWFGKLPSQLNLGEAALLAGLLQSPTRFRPDRYPEAAKKRREYVLERMERLGMIDARQRTEAAGEKLVLRRAPRPFAEPFFCDWAQRSDGLVPGDYRTTLDPAVQEAVRGLLSRQASAQDVDAAVVVLEVGSGAVRSLVCSGDYFAVPEGQVNTALAPRPAGSTLKPFAFALAIDRGQLTPGWVLADVPRRFGADEPLNFSGTFQGLVTAREALIQSLNLPAIEVEERVGQRVFYEALRRLGFEALDRPASHYGLGLVLGNGSVRLTELANAYACLARGGAWRPCRAFEGEPGSGHQEERRVFSAGACWMVADALSGDERARDAVGHVAEAELPRFAWKTGTSSGFRDAWTVAWNPEYVVAVWCGYKSGRRGDETLVGKRVAAPLAWQIVRQLYPAGGAPAYVRPDTVVGREVCAVSGRPPGPLCGRLKTDWALRQCSSCGVCPVHTRDAQGIVAERWPAEVSAFLDAKAGQAPPAGGLKIIAPADGTVVRLLEGVGAQQVVFKVTGAQSAEPVYWFRNDALEGASSGGTVFLWTPRRGQHRFVCANPSGASAAVSVRVE